MDENGLFLSPIVVSFDTSFVMPHSLNTFPQAYKRGVAMEEQMFQTYAQNAIAQAQDRGCTNVFPIVKAATSVNHVTAPPSHATTGKGQSNTKKRLGLTWEG